MKMKSGKKALSPHKEDRVVSKPAYKAEMKPEHSSKQGKGDFEKGHVVMDAEAGKVKASREKQKSSKEKSLNYMEGVGAPGNESAKLPHHNEHDMSNFMGGDKLDSDGDYDND